MLAGAIGLVERHATAQSLTTSIFERYLESLRQQAGIPGLSAVIVQDGIVVWQKGFGFRDLENLHDARADTPYLIGDLTQTFASVLLLQCAQRGTLKLGDSLSSWGLAGGTATVQQALAHATSPNGNGFRYDPTQFALLTRAVDACGGESARLRVVKEMFGPLAMVDSVPGRDLDEPTNAARPAFDQSQLDKYTAVLARLALPYKVDRRGRATRSELPPKQIDASTGLVSSVLDLAAYDKGLTEKRLLNDDSLQTMWNNQTAAGTTRPTGLGWFVQVYNNQRIVWHFGNITDAYSSLILKVPEKRLTLILLANSDGLSASFDLSQGDVTKSLFALTFLRLFL